MNSNQATVVAIHGFGSKRMWMWPLCHRLRNRGYNMEVWGYSTLFRNLSDHASALRKYLLQLSERVDQLTVVAHSMGAVVVRAALQGSRLNGLDRLVFLAPPNRGSPVANLLAKSGLGRLCPPLNDLSTTERSFVNLIEKTQDYEIGVIAARFDTLVPVAYSHCTCESDHIVLNATHNSLLVSKQAGDQVHHFFATGHFHR